MTSLPLWLASAKLEENAGNVAKARALLEQARLKNPKQEQLWLAAVSARFYSALYTNVTVSVHSSVCTAEAGLLE